MPHPSSSKPNHSCVCCASLRNINRQHSSRKLGRVWQHILLWGRGVAMAVQLRNRSRRIQRWRSRTATLMWRLPSGYRPSKKRHHCDASQLNFLAVDCAGAGGHGGGGAGQPGAAQPHQPVAQHGGRRPVAVGPAGARRLRRRPLPPGLPGAAALGRQPRRWVSAFSGCFELNVRGGSEHTSGFLHGRIHGAPMVRGCRVKRAFDC